MAGRIRKTAQRLGIERGTMDGSVPAGDGYVKGISPDGRDEDRSLPEAIFDEELKSVAQSRPARGIPVPDGEGQGLRDELVGLALSGGGIRAAVFSIGVMQALAKKNVLRYADYLSTVSGGGYAGGALTWFLNGPGARTTAPNAAEAQRDPGDTESKANNPDGWIAKCRTGFDTLMDDLVELGRGPLWSSFGVGSTNLPFGVRRRVGSGPIDPADRMGRDQERILSHLRQHGNYLTPGAGVSGFSLFGVIARGMLLNSIVWVPLSVLAMILILSAAQWVGSNDGQFLRAESVIQFIGPGTSAKTGPAQTGGLHFAQQRTLHQEKLPSDPGPRSALTLPAPTEYWGETDAVRRGLLLPVVGLGLLFSVICVVYSVLTVVHFKKWTRLARWINGPSWFRVVDAGWTAMKAKAVDPRITTRYLTRRVVETQMGRLVRATLLLTVLAALPWVHEWLANQIAQTGIASLVAGVAAGVFSYFRSGAGGGTSGKKDLVLKVLPSAGAILFLGGLALTIYGLALEYARGDSWLHGWAVYALLLSVVTGVIVNLNFISIHRYYRDRLMETFMPDPDQAGQTGPAWGANRANLSEVCREDGPKLNGPYPLINVNTVLVDSDRPRFWHRGGDNFILSPLYCGSFATGWRKTKVFMEDKLTLPTAVAISGAAMHPNTGVGGAGPTRNRALSLLMALLNLRLGYWVRNPNPRKTLVDRGFFKRPNHFHALSYEILSDKYQEEAAFLQLSDGGHFENLGVYELIRRRARLVICCDAGADPKTNFSDLRVLLSRIEEDFGATITFDGSPDASSATSSDVSSANANATQDPELNALIPEGESQYPHLEAWLAKANTPKDAELNALIPKDESQYRDGVKLAQRGHAFGRIHYRDGTEGDFVLLKTTMIKGLDLGVRNYKLEHKGFPDESTGDQFFDEEQFEAYRVLGYDIASRMLEDEGLPSTISDGKNVTLQGLLDELFGGTPTGSPSDPQATGAAAGDRNT